MKNLLMTLALIVVAGGLALIADLRNWDVQLTAYTAYGISVVAFIGGRLQAGHRHVVAVKAERKAT